ncbi:MAG: ATP-binding protein [Defluviitaleaceae bacterium]|nr:ATP-binding protein [Defluviitaleaceae bacterium]
MTINDIGVSFRDFFNAIPAPCICFDASCEPFECNHALAGLVGAPSRTSALKLFDDEEFKKNIAVSLEFTYICDRGDSDEKIVLLLNTKRLEGGIVIAYVKEIKLTEARRRLMLDSAPMAITFFDSELEIVDCNFEAVKVFGFAEKADYLEHFMRLMPPIQPNGRSSKKLILEYMKEAIETGYSKYHFVRQKIDGSLMHTEASFLRAEHDGEYVIIGYSRDLTDIHDAEERAREATELAQIFQDSSPVGMEIWDEQHQIVDCNRQVYEMFGFVDKNSFLTRIKEEWTGEHVHPVYLQQALEDGTFRYEWEFTRTDGKKLPCEVQLVRAVRDGLLQVMAYFFDMSSIQKALEAVREADKRNQLMLNRTPLACFLVRENLAAIDCNNAAIELFGFENKVDALMRYRDIFPPGKLPKSLDWIGVSEPTRFEFDHKSASTDELIPCEVTMNYLDYQGQPIIACFMNDLREQKAMIADLKKKELAEEESRAKSQFLARMSHEIRTPLNSIMGVADIQLLGYEHPAETEEAFLQIRSSSKILLSIINDILDLSKVEAGKMKITNKPYEIASIIFDTVQLNMMHIGSKPINFNLVVSEDIPQILVGDELRIKQVLNNLLSNAFKYTREGEVNLSFSVEYGDEDDVSLLIDLSDTGQGMTDDQIASLFQSEYVRFNEEKNRMIEGTGLGMNITNKMIEMMQGEITAESEVGTGSTFRVRLPQKLGNKQTLGPDIVENLQNFQLSQRAFHKRHYFTYEHMPYGNVLVVDDVESNLFVAKGLLVPYGLTVDTATSGFEALHKVKNGNVYDVIFMDHMMPDMDGIETVKMMRDVGYNEPVVALTANTIIGQAELFMANGFAGFISKPIDVTKMNGYLMSLIRDKQPPEVIEAAKASSPNQVDLSGALVDSFLRDAERSYSILDALLHNTNWGDEEYKLYTINTHGLKSALANVGRTQLSGTAGSLEQAGRDQSADLILAQTKTFLEDLRLVVRELSPKEDDSVSADSENKIRLHAGLEKIQIACDAYNKKVARITLDELNKHAWTKETKAFLGDIAACLLHSDFEKVSEDIGAFLSKGE